MNDIIRESGMSKGGVYHYFNSKNIFLIELWNHFFNTYAAANIFSLENDESLKSQATIEKIEIMFQRHEGMLDQMGKDIGLMMDLYIEAIHNKDLRKVFNQQYKLVLEIISRLIKTAQKEGDIRKEVDPMLLASALIAIFDGFGLTHQIIDDDTRHTPKKALDAARLMLQGARI